MGESPFQNFDAFFIILALGYILYMFLNPRGFKQDILYPPLYYFL